MNGISESDVFEMMFHHFPDSEMPGILGSITKKKLDAIITTIGSRPTSPAQEWLVRAARRPLSTGAIGRTFGCVRSIPAVVGLITQRCVSIGKHGGKLFGLDVFRQ